MRRVTYGLTVLFLALACTLATAPEPQPIPAGFYVVWIRSAVPSYGDMVGTLRVPKIGDRIRVRITEPLGDVLRDTTLRVLQLPDGRFSLEPLGIHLEGAIDPKDPTRLLGSVTYSDGSAGVWGAIRQ